MRLPLALLSIALLPAAPKIDPYNTNPEVACAALKRDAAAYKACREDAIARWRFRTEVSWMRPVEELKAIPPEDLLPAERSRLENNRQKPDCTPGQCALLKQRYQETKAHIATTNLHRKQVQWMQPILSAEICFVPLVKPGVAFENRKKMAEEGAADARAQLAALHASALSCDAPQVKKLASCITEYPPYEDDQNAACSGKWIHDRMDLLLPPLKLD